MADSKISNLSAQTTIADTDMLVLATAGGATKKITGANLKSQVIASYLSSGLDRYSWSPATGIHAATTTGTWAYFTGVIAQHPYGIEFYNSTHANTDAITWIFPRVLQAGTYSFRFATRKNTNVPILTFETSVDASAWTALTTYDAYAASSSYVTTTVTGLTIPANTLYMRMSTPTKNASSTDYYAVLGVFDLFRTA